MFCSRIRQSCLALLFAGGAVLAAVGAGAVDTAAGAASYYEEQIGSATLAALESADPGLPAALHVLEAEGGAEYRLVEGGGTQLEWEVHLELAERAHERVDAVYDLVLALPLPEEFSPAQWGIGAREGTEGNSVPLIYGGEKVVLKRNVALEKTWLPQLLSSGGLPDLGGSGYAFTLWDAVLRYDPSHGPSVQALASLRYATPAGVAAPDPDDVVFGAFLITWIPTLDAAVAPYAVRIDVRPPAGE